MLVRIVKLTFKKENIASFEQIFNRTKQKIRDCDSCLFLELYQDNSNPAIFFTYSHWENEKRLKIYRDSKFFRSVWGKTKILFAEKPEAWSVAILETLN